MANANNKTIEIISLCIKIDYTEILFNKEIFFIMKNNRKTERKIKIDKDYRKNKFKKYIEIFNNSYFYCFLSK